MYVSISLSLKYILLEKRACCFLSPLSIDGPLIYQGNLGRTKWDYTFGHEEEIPS